MPPQRRSAEGPDQVPADEKIARLIAMMVVRDVEQPADKIQILKAAGFGVSQMAPILAMTENAINVALHRARKKDGRASKKKSATKKIRK
jgi:hypothetical protein